MSDGIEYCVGDGVVMMMLDSIKLIFGLLMIVINVNGIYFDGLVIYLNCGSV